MRYSQIREMDVSNGKGVGISLFVQGCHFHCKGCFNPETWDFNGGKLWTQEREEEFIELANKPWIKRISFLGGEPLADENVETIANLIEKLKEVYPEKKIWVYTGYTWESIWHHFWSPNDDINNTVLLRRKVARLSDVMVDGQFQLENQDLFNKDIVWAGSTNQRVIDTKKSINENHIIYYT